MKSENTTKIKEKIIKLIGIKFPSDAAFEREMGIAKKTVNNWRRGTSSSYMKMLTEISDKLGVSMSELLDTPITQSAPDLSPDELKFLELYRKSEILPTPKREALTKTLQSVINLCLDSSEKE